MIGLLLLSLLFGAVAGFLFAAAENHPAPSQTALIPAFFICAGMSVLLFAATVIAYLARLTL